MSQKCQKQAEAKKAVHLKKNSLVAVMLSDLHYFLSDPRTWKNLFMGTFKGKKM